MIATSLVSFALALSTDSTPVFTLREFLREIEAHHPVARQAELIERMGSAGLQSARGAFDPVVSAQWERKQFEGKSYFEYLDATVKIPTIIGWDLKVQFERNAGVQAAPDRRTLSGGLLSAGVSVPVGQGMLTDQRRTAAIQARALRDYSRAERLTVMNKLLATAAEVYADWYEAHRRHVVATDGVRLAEFRLDGVRRRVSGGESPAIDTVEARLEVRRRRIAMQEAAVNVTNAATVVEGYRWSTAASARAMAEAVPEALRDVIGIDATSVARWLAREHPEVSKALAKVRDTEADRALARQRAFVPQAQVAVAGLSDPNTPELGEASYKSMAEIYVPVLFRKERGKLGQSDGKWQLARADEALTRRSIEIAIRTLSAELTTVVGLIAEQRELVAGAEQLRDAEQRRFEAGESSLFLVNARERAVLEEAVKLAALEAKYIRSRGKLGVAVGGMAQLEP